jgi:hypothetical protein
MRFLSPNAYVFQGILRAREAGNNAGFLLRTTAWLGVAWGSSLIALMAQFTAQPADPQITKIERFGTNQVLIHFDTEPNRTYVLQYANSLSFTNWSNKYTGFAFPFSEHYIVPDYRTNNSRVYRLCVTP